jgi:DNA primase
MLARYWLDVATRALPGIAKRPLALTRFSTGIAAESFFQKHAMPGQPKELRAEAARLLRQNLEEEKRADQLLSKLAKSEVNPAAASNRDEEKSAQSPAKHRRRT